MGVVMVSMIFCYVRWRLDKAIEALDMDEKVQERLEKIMKQSTSLVINFTTTWLLIADLYILQMT